MVFLVLVEGIFCKYFSKAGNIKCEFNLKTVALPNKKINSQKLNWLFDNLKVLHFLWIPSIIQIKEPLH